MPKNGSKRSAWTSEQVLGELKTMARKKTPAPRIAKKLKRTEGATRQKAFSMGLSLEAPRVPDQPTPPLPSGKITLGNRGASVGVNSHYFSGRDLPWPVRSYETSEELARALGEAVARIGAACPPPAVARNFLSPGGVVAGAFFCQRPRAPHAIILYPPRQRLQHTPPPSLNRAAKHSPTLQNP